MRYVTLALLFKYEQGLIVFNTRSCNYSKCKALSLQPKQMLKNLLKIFYAWPQGGCNFYVFFMYICY